MTFSWILELLDDADREYAIRKFDAVNAVAFGGRNLMGDQEGYEKYTKEILEDYELTL